MTKKVNPKIKDFK